MKQFFVNTWATILRVGTALIAVFRGAGQGMTVLAVMMIADYITGVLRAALGKSDKTSGGRLENHMSHNCRRDIYAYDNTYEKKGKTPDSHRASRGGDCGGRSRRDTNIGRHAGNRASAPGILRGARR